MLIFHSPLQVHRDGAYVSGSTIRPHRMLTAFMDIGIEVHVIDGCSSRRAAKWAALAQEPIKQVLGVYSELSTMPIALADPDHLPRSPFLDFAQFARLRHRGVPVTAFYRDVYWRFPNYARMVPSHKSLAAMAFYWLEAWQLARHVDHVFLPSQRMKDYVPFIRDKVGVSALPPGGVIQETERAERSGQLRLFYVGGVGGEQYDIGPMLRAVESVDGVQLTLCCRETDWQAARESYGDLRNVVVVHQSGPQLEVLYRSADIFLMWWSMVEYLRFAMPVKLGEAIGWGLPVIANADCEMGDVVAGDGLGWTPGTEQELAALLRRLRDAPEEVAAAQAKVLDARAKHSWRARAETVLSTLREYRGR